MLRVQHVEIVPLDKSAWGGPDQLSNEFRVICNLPLIEGTTYSEGCARLSRALMGTPYAPLLSDRQAQADTEMRVRHSGGEALTAEILNQLLEDLPLAYVRTQRSGEMPGLTLFHCDQYITYVILHRIRQIKGVSCAEQVITHPSMASGKPIMVPLASLYEAYHLIAVVIEPRVNRDVVEGQIEDALELKGELVE